VISLPDPEKNQGISLNQAIFQRYSLRSFSEKKLSFKQLSNLLWAAGGCSKYRRTIPSAGATYPLEIYLIVGENSVVGLEAGFYLYLWRKHALDFKKEGDFRERLTRACLGQDFIAQAPVSILISAYYERTTIHYGKRGIRYVLMEVGHACQNIHLEAVALGLGTVVVGAFYDRELKILLGLKEEPLAIMPVGYPENSN
jgi:SagB-type dehydrogenase family enzyme